MPSSVRAYGPPPRKQMSEDFLRAYRTTIDFWAEEHPALPPLLAIDAHEVSSPGPVMEDDNVKVTAAIVRHPPVKPALGYRFDFHDRSIAFSGDTSPMQSVVELAKGCDVLVHEAIYPNPNQGAAVVPPLNGDARVDTGDRRGSAIAGDAQKLLAHVLGSHTPVEEAGRIAQEAGVKTLVLAHTVSLMPGVTDGMWIAAAKKHFSGEVIFAHDLMVL